MSKESPTRRVRLLLAASSPRDGRNHVLAPSRRRLLKLDLSTWTLAQPMTVQFLHHRVRLLLAASSPRDGRNHVLAPSRRRFLELDLSAWSLAQSMTIQYLHIWHHVEPDHSKTMP
ncbi:hypothetical protein HYQ46_007703 [Verticillium longisporum]|nr:hypothetical protein HYQ46_007703 [Verticillium longisporum]